MKTSLSQKRTVRKRLSRKDPIRQSWETGFKPASTLVDEWWSAAAKESSRDGFSWQALSERVFLPMVSWAWQHTTRNRSVLSVSSSFVTLRKQTLKKDIWVIVGRRAESTAEWTTHLWISLCSVLLFCREEWAFCFSNESLSLWTPNPPSSLHVYLCHRPLFTDGEQKHQERPQLVLIRDMNRWWDGRRATSRSNPHNVMPEPARRGCLLKCIGI